LPASNPAVRLVRGSRIRLAPGQPTGVHFHQASVVGIVTEGAIRFQPEGEPMRVLRAGDCFFEPANHVISHFDNASDCEPAVFMAFYLTDDPTRPLIESLATP
jgi:quercetin dioxygenase-like cupin family protein